MGEVRRWRVCGLAGCAEVRARAAKNDCAWAWLAAETERQRPEARQGKAGRGECSARRKAGNGDGRDGATRRNKTPRAHTGSVNHVRLCATRPSFSRCRLSRLGRLGTSRRGGCRPAGLPVEQGGGYFFSSLVLFLSFLAERVCSRCCLWSCSCWSFAAHARGC